MAYVPTTSHRPRPLQGVVIGSLVALLVLMGVGRSLASEPSDTAATSSEDAAAPSAVVDTSVEGTSKREVVYAHLADNGAVEGVYIVNLFESTPAGPVTDYGDYAELRNLTNSATLTQTGDEVSFEGADDPFIYEGTLANPILPWTITMDYSLNGAPINPSDLGGATGHLAMTITTAPSPEVDATYSENYMLQISLTLPSDHVSSLEAGSGQVAMAASNYNVTFMVMPETEGDFELSADVTDFEMDAVNFAAVPLSFAIASPDTDELISGFEQLGDGVDTLSDGAGSLATGSGELAEGLDEFGSGAATLADGSAQTASGAASLSEGGESLASGGASLASGAVAVAANIRELASGLAEFRAGLEAQAAASAGQADAIGPAVPDTSAIESAVADYAASYSAAYSDSYTSAFLSSYMTLINQGADPSVAAADAAQTAASSSAYQAANSVAALSALSAIGDAAGAVAAEAAEVGGLQGAAEALQGAADNLAALASGATELAGGADSLADGAGELASGASELAEGTKSLAEGAGELANGASQLAEGAHSASSGAHQLSDGAGELASGTSELSGEVRKMPDEVQAQIDDMLSAYDRSDYVPISFASPKNTDVSLVQFVLSTDPITAPDGGTVEEPESDDENFIDRLFSLFS